MKKLILTALAVLFILSSTEIAWGQATSYDYQKLESFIKRFAQTMSFDGKEVKISVDNVRLVEDGHNVIYLGGYYLVPSEITTSTILYRKITDGSGGFAYWRIEFEGGVYNAYYNLYDLSKNSSNKKVFYTEFRLVSKSYSDWTSLASEEQAMDFVTLLKKF